MLLCTTLERILLLVAKCRCVADSKKQHHHRGGDVHPDVASLDPRRASMAQQPASREQVQHDVGAVGSESSGHSEAEPISALPLPPGDRGSYPVIGDTMQFARNPIAWVQSKLEQHR